MRTLALFLILLPVAGAAEPLVLTPQSELQGMPAPDSIGAPVFYSDTVLVVTTKDCVAAVQFTKPLEIDDRRGMSYRYRFWTGGVSEELRGGGEVFERIPNMAVIESQDLPPEAAKPLPSKTVVQAGSIEMVWSFSTPEKGFIYYSPEDMRVQIAAGGVQRSTSLFHPRKAKGKDIDRFDALDLRRFAW